MSATPDRRIRISAILLGLSGAVYLLSAAVYCPFTVALLDANSPADPVVADAVRRSRIWFSVIGILLICLSQIAQRTSLLNVILQRERAPHCLMASLLVLVPLSLVELGFRPLALKRLRTTVFVADDELGWKLRPGAEDSWGGVRIKINAKGLRGPELSYGKSPGTQRIVVLGDSVAFGHGLAAAEQAFPLLIQQTLNASSLRPVEVINAGVGGYSPWQEYIYLVNEGIRYEPDLVVVAFVLNDVTEKFFLRRFGGNDEEFHLMRAARLYDQSGLAYLTHAIATRWRFGSNVRKEAARQEALNVRLLCDDPTHPKIENAWRITLASLGRIFSFCRDRDIELLLVIFPFTFQFESGVEAHPQRILKDFAAKTDVATIDLLEILSKSMAQSGLTLRDLFLDADHLSVLGSEVVAEVIATHIVETRLLRKKK